LRLLGKLRSGWEFKEISLNEKGLSFGKPLKNTII